MRRTGLLVRRALASAGSGWILTSAVLLVCSQNGVAQAQDPRNVLTQGHDNHRTGAFSSELVLTPQNVRSARFGLLYEREVEGHILGQPLYVRAVETVRGRKNLLIVATAANMVYAFDADNVRADSNAAIVWRREIGESTVVSKDKQTSDADAEQCLQTSPSYFGVTATPVIDAVTSTLFVVAYDTSRRVVGSQPARFGEYVLHALDLRDGLRDKIGDGVVLSAPGFSSHRGRNRAGLLFMDGTVYAAFAAFICDHPLDFSGWVFAYRATDLQQVGAFRTDASLFGAGIWQSGRGLVGDAGHVYFMTGNENASIPRDNTIANSIVKLDAPGNGHGLQLAARFTPKNSVELSLGDTDLGSSGPILLPGNRLLGAGKQGRVYVLNPDAMTLTQNQGEPDGFEGFQGFLNTWHTDRSQPECAPNAQAICKKRLAGTYPYLTDSGRETANDNCPKDELPENAHSERCRVIEGWLSRLGQQTPSGDINGCYLPVACYQFDQGMGPNVHAGFVYWDGYPDAAHGRLYALAEKDYLRAFDYNRGTGYVQESAIAVNQSIRSPDGMPGGALSLSSVGGHSGVLWVSKHDPDAMNCVNPGRLMAVDAASLEILWQDPVQGFAKFVPPIIADGHVVLPTWGADVINKCEQTMQLNSKLRVYGVKSDMPALTHILLGAGR